MNDEIKILEQKYLPLYVTEIDKTTAVVDEHGGRYSTDGKRLLKFKNKCEDTYTVKNGTKVCCEKSFQGRIKLKEICIPDSLTEIGHYAFGECTSLTSINLPEGISSIRYRTFWRCRSLTSILLPQSLQVIEQEAFADCESLEKITIPKDVTTIGYEAFYGCTSLEEITICSSSISLSGYCSFEHLKKINISKDVMELRGDVFASCKNPIELVIEEGNKYLCIMNGALYSKDMRKLLWVPPTIHATSFKIDERVHFIAPYAFYNCRNIYSISIPEGLISIGENAFYNCSSLAKIYIPKRVTSIGNGAFRNCSSLAKIYIPEFVTSIGDGAFSGTSLTHIEVARNNFYYCSKDGILFSKDMRTLIRYPKALENISYSIPDTITTIGNYAFEDSDKLMYITIPRNTMSLGVAAFNGCTGLEKIVSLNPNPPKLCELNLHPIIFTRFSPFWIKSIHVFSTGMNICTLYVPKGSREVYLQTHGWRNFKHIVEME